MKTNVFTSLSILFASTAAMAMPPSNCWLTTNVYTVVVQPALPPWATYRQLDPIILTFVTTNVVCAPSTIGSGAPMALGISLTNRIPLGATNRYILNSSNTFNVLMSQQVDPFATNQPSIYFQCLKTLKLQSTTNLLNWKTEYTGTNWFSYGSSTLVWYSNNVPVATNVGLSCGKWHCDPLPPTENVPAKFYRITE